MNSANWNNEIYDYCATDFLYHSGILVYSVVSITPAYKLLSVIAAGESSGHSLYPILMIFCLLISLMPLSFFRGVKRGDLLLKGWRKHPVVPNASPSWFNGAGCASVRAAALPFFLVLPFLIAFPASSSYPVENVLVFLFIPPSLFLLTALMGVSLGSHCFYMGDESTVNLFKDTGCALSFVLPIVIFIPFFFHQSLMFNLLLSTYCWKIALLVDKLFTSLVTNWIVLLLLVGGLSVPLLFEFRRLFSIKEGKWFNRKLKQALGNRRLNKLLASSICHDSFGKTKEETRDASAAKGILWAGFFLVFLELMWLLPSPGDPWSRFFFNVGVFVTFSVPAAWWAWPDWEMAFSYSFRNIVKRCALVVMISLFCTVLVMVWKETFVGPEEFIVFLTGHFLVSVAVVSVVQMLHPQVTINIDSPGGAPMSAPALDGYILFLLEAVFALVGASWATGVYFFYGGPFAWWVEPGWFVITLINGMGILFFFNIIPLWVCHGRMGSNRLNAEVF